MWLRLGSYPDREIAMEIASKLKNSGVRVEVREIAEWDFEERYFLKGKLSELEEYEEAQEWKTRIEKMREILKGRIETSKFEKEVLKTFEPEAYEKLMKLKDENISEEDFLDSMESALKASLLISSIVTFLRINGFVVNEDYIEGQLPDDPTIIIELNQEVEGCDKEYILQLYPSWDVNVDVLSVITKDVELGDTEGVALNAASRIVMNIIAGLEETNDIEKLKEFASGIIDDSGLDGNLYVDAEDLFETIIKALERAGIVRVSGKKIKMRK